MDLQKFSRGDWIVSGVALLLALDVSAFRFVLHIRFNYFSWGLCLGVVLVAASGVLTNRARVAGGPTVSIAPTA